MFLAILTKLGLVVHAVNLSSQKAKASRSEFKASMVSVHSEFQAGKGYRVRPCLKKQKQDILIENRNNRKRVLKK